VSILAKAQAVIGAGDAVRIAASHAERHTAVGAQVIGDHDLLTVSIDHQRRIQKLGRDGAV
jgi:hypothetical protein